jgi:hypothetical protein
MVRLSIEVVGALQTDHFLRYINCTHLRRININNNIFSPPDDAIVLENDQQRQTNRDDCFMHIIPNPKPSVS